MEPYILKSAACLAIFFVFYKVFLENASFHKFKRSYLLGSLAASFLIPFITFTTYIEPIAVTSVPQFFETTIINTATTGTIKEPFNYLNLLWLVYGFGVLFFTLRFIKNIATINSNIKNNTKEKNGNFMHILLTEFVAPHTFFNNIFFYKTAYNTGNIPKEVIWHEETHAAQKHSLDIVLIELLQVVFWFNPLIFFFKNSIKLNHEFLADSAVLKKQQDALSYQKILLEYSTTANSPVMANAINYSSIKKRFRIMKTQTSKKTGLLKGLLIVPLLSLLIYGFSTTKEQVIVEESNNTTVVNVPLAEDNISINEQTHLTARSISIKILDANFIEIEGLKILKKNLYEMLGSLNTDITKKQRDRIINIHVSALNDIAYEDLIFIQKVAMTYGYHRIVTPNEVIIRSKGNVPVAPESEVFAHKNYVREYMEDAEKNKIKPFVLQIERNKLHFNDKEVALKDLAKTIDNYTKDWTIVDFKETKTQVFVSNTPKNFLDKVDTEFRKTNFSKVNNGMNIVPPPPPPAPKVKRGENSNIPPPPPPPEKNQTQFKFNTQQFSTGQSIDLNKKKELATSKSKVFYKTSYSKKQEKADVEQDKKYNQSVSIYIERESIFLDGILVTLNSFAEALNKKTAAWKQEDFKLYGLSIHYKNIEEQTIKNINKAYLDSELAKKSSVKNPELISIAYASSNENSLFSNKQLYENQEPTLLKRTANGSIEVKDLTQTISMQNTVDRLYDDITPQNTEREYASTYLKGAERNNKKAFVLQIEMSTVKFNGVQVPLNKLVKTIDAYTKDWEGTDYTHAQPSILIASTSKTYLDKVDTEFRNTNFSKKNGGINIVPPPPPLAPKIKKGEKSNIPPPPGPPVKNTNSDIKYETVESIKAMKEKDSNGYLKINGSTYFYVKDKNKIQYFNRWGELVNEKGEKITR